MTEPLDELTDDGLVARPAGPWVLDKLGILACYDHAFGVAYRGAGRWYYVEGFAGSGVQAIQGRGRRVPGSALIALRTEPQFRRCLLVERNRLAAEALGSRTAEFGDRALVLRGDANAELVPAMQIHVSRSHPCLCVLDPEGADLDWSTVAAVADFRSGQPHKVEQLILLPTDTGFLRELPLATAPAEWAAPDVDRIFGGDRWRRLYERRRRGAITPDDARIGYARLYLRGLRELGYRTVLGRPILQHGRSGRPLYFLFFATDNEYGERILSDCFDSVFGAGSS